jgi:hypothetical protein
VVERIGFGRAVVCPVTVVALIVGATAGLAFGGEEGGRLGVDVDGGGATVGDRIPFRLCLTLPPGGAFEPQAIGPELGPFTVAAGAWRPGDGAGGGCDWSFDGAIAGYETGEQELPAIGVTVQTADGPIEVRSEPVVLAIESVLASEGETSTLEIADLKEPRSIAPDHGPLFAALAGVVGLLAIAGAVWWIHRRYASRWTAAPVRPDPFERMSPDEWAFQALKALLDRRLHEHGQVDEFHAEVARILKRYLGGRFRVDLLECTTAEVGPALLPAGASDDTVSAVGGLLGRCDAVKFARERPDALGCRELVDEAYRLIDATRPPAVRSSEEGAA